MSSNPLMCNDRGWMAIDSMDADPLAEPPDEVVALLDAQVLQDLLLAKRAHDERLRRSRAPLLPPPDSRPADGGAWWRVVHAPAVLVRADLEDFDHVGVGEMSECACFDAQEFEAGVATGSLVHLERDRASQPHIRRTKHRPHSASADLRIDAVVLADHRPRVEVRQGGL